MDPHSSSEIACGSLIGRGRCTWSIMPNEPQIYTTHLADYPGLARWCRTTYTTILALADDLQASSICLEIPEDTYVPPHVIWSNAGYYKRPPLVHCFWGSYSSLWHSWTSLGLLEGPTPCIDYYLTSWEAYFFIYELVWWACHQKLDY